MDRCQNCSQQGALKSCLAHRILLIDQDPASKEALPLQEAVAERELAWLQGHASLSLSLRLPGMESPP